MEMLRDATLSPNGVYRWTLSRRWGDGDDVLWIMLNPSTADATKDDPTIQRIVRFSDGWGYGGLCVVNLYPYRTSDPAACRRWVEALDDPDAMYQNAEIIAQIAPRSALTLAAWGAAPWAQTWAKGLIADWMGAAKLHCLGKAANGAPKHPLARGRNRIPDTQQPEPWPPLAAPARGEEQGGER